MQRIKGKTVEEVVRYHRKDIMNNPLLSQMWLPFSLLVLRDMLKAFDAYASQKWSHNDIHSNNIILNSDFHKNIITFIDFDDVADSSIAVFKGTPNDFMQILTVFVRLLTGKVTVPDDVLKCYRQNELKQLEDSMKVHLKEILVEAENVKDLKDLKDFQNFIKRKFELLKDRLKIDRNSILLSIYDCIFHKLPAS